jgi:hypothetical protein
MGEAAFGGPLSPWQSSQPAKCNARLQQVMKNHPCALRAIRKHTTFVVSPALNQTCKLAQFIIDSCHFIHFNSFHI